MTNKILPFCDKYNINLEYLEICGNFINIVVDKILVSYLGKEYMNTDEICENHYNFWWDKISNIFLRYSNINFKIITKARDYFKKIIFRMLYHSKLENLNSIITSSITSIFKFEEYSEKDLDVILSVNKLFEYDE